MVAQKGRFRANVGSRTLAREFGGKVPLGAGEAEVGEGGGDRVVAEDVEHEQSVH